ncbi:MAG: AsmA family protein [Janthinobacterium lividum]
MAQSRMRLWPFVVGVPIVAIVLLVVFWRWDWFVPLVDSRASAALGRKVTVSHLHVHLGRVTTVTVDDPVVAEPADFPEDKPFATARTLAISVDVMAYIRSRTLVLPVIAVDGGQVVATSLPDGRNNWTLGAAKPAGSAPSKGGGLPQIGDLRIADTHVQFTDAKAKAAVGLDVSTREATGDTGARIVAQMKGRYSDQPITGGLVAGALLSLQDHKDPYPVDLHVENGPTKVTLVGTVDDPLHFAGANLKLGLTGPDMSLLFPLTGIPIPETPAYSIAGNLGYDAGAKKVQFHQFAGKVGDSDLGGDIDVAMGGEKPVVDMNLTSKRVDLADLGGFIGTAPGRSTGKEAPETKERVAKAEHSGHFLPDKPINLPVVKAADLHVQYRGEKIVNKYVPMDDISFRIDVVDGKIDVHPLKFGLGNGEILATIAVDAPAKRINSDISFRHLSLAKIMASTHSFAGDGTITGEAKIDGAGTSLAQMMATGNGGLKLSMSGGGDLSALLLNIAGLEFGKAILSALGMPEKAKVQCFVSDFVLNDGLLQTKVFLLQTSEERTTATGNINFKGEKLDLALTTRSTHFSIGSLPGPINIGGTLSSPSVLPGAEVAARTGAAVGLGILAGPLALLPTIQFGTGEGEACAKAASASSTPIVAHPVSTRPAKAPVRQGRHR